MYSSSSISPISKFNLSCSILVMSSFYEKCSILLLVISKFRQPSSILLISILLRMIPFYNLKISPIQKLYEPFRILLITKLYSPSTNLKISSFYWKLFFASRLNVYNIIIIGIPTSIPRSHLASLYFYWQHSIATIKAWASCTFPHPKHLPFR